MAWGNLLCKYKPVLKKTDGVAIGFVNITINLGCLFHAFH